MKKEINYTEGSYPVEEYKKLKGQTVQIEIDTSKVYKSSNVLNITKGAPHRVKITGVFYDYDDYGIFWDIYFIWNNMHGDTRTEWETVTCSNDLMNDLMSQLNQNKDEG